MKRHRIWLLLILLVSVLSGCAGAVKNMSVIPMPPGGFTPEADKAMVVFMRPSGMAFAIQSAVFEIVNDEPQLIGVLAAKKLVVHQVDPGEHLFMVIGESADFMGATLGAGKVYYAKVVPRMGAWKARFSLDPISRDEQANGRYKQWVNGCQWLAVNADTQKWFEGNLASIKKKQVGYFPKWEAKASKPMLRVEDGVVP